MEHSPPPHFHSLGNISEICKFFAPLSFNFVILIKERKTYFKSLIFRRLPKKVSFRDPRSLGRIIVNVFSLAISCHHFPVGFGQQLQVLAVVVLSGFSHLQALFFILKLWSQHINMEYLRCSFSVWGCYAIL